MKQLDEDEQHDDDVVAGNLILIHGIEVATDITTNLLCSSFLLTNLSCFSLD